VLCHASDRGTPPRAGQRLSVVVLDLSGCDLLEGDRQIVFRAGFDHRGRELVERSLAEVVVVAVDLSRALGGIRRRSRSWSRRCRADGRFGGRSRSLLPFLGEIPSVVGAASVARPHARSEFGGDDRRELVERVLEAIVDDHVGQTRAERRAPARRPAGGARPPRRRRCRARSGACAAPQATAAR